MSTFRGPSLDPPEEPELPPQVEQAWEIMETAGVDEAIIEQVCKIIEDLAIEADQECQRCLAQWAKEEQEHEAEIEEYFKELEQRGNDKV